MSIYTIAPATWTNDLPVPNANTFNKEIHDRLTDIDTAIAVEVTARNAAIAAIYPIGCIYTTVVATNPATIFGFGTWAAFGAGKVLVGLNGAETEFDTVEETGGEKTHTLITAEMPAHTHNLQYTTAPGGETNIQVIAGSSHYDTPSESTGGGAAHNNLPPYITVYFFKRTA